MINNIQVLRAFAAINVVLFHIIGTSSSYNQATSIFSYLDGWGANGVDIFFVISGFVMLHTQLLRRRSPVEFFVNRIVRIVPIYWIISAFVVVMFLSIPSVFRETHVSLLWIVSSLFFTSTVVTGTNPILHVGWTLEWEMFFYLIFAIGLFFDSWKAQVCFVLVALVSAAVIVGELIVLEFVLGMFVAYVYKNLRLSSKQGVFLFAIGALLVLGSVLPEVKNLELDRFILWGIPAALLVLGLLYCHETKSRFDVYLGDASYSIYLVQVLTIPAFYKFSSRFLTGFDGDFLAVLCLALSIAFGCLVFSLVEKPTTVKLKKLLGS